MHIPGTYDSPFIIISNLIMRRKVNSTYWSVKGIGDSLASSPSSSDNRRSFSSTRSSTDSNIDTNRQIARPWVMLETTSLRSTLTEWNRHYVMDYIPLPLCYGLLKARELVFKMGDTALGPSMCRRYWIVVLIPTSWGRWICRQKIATCLVGHNGERSR